MIRLAVTIFVLSAGVCTSVPFLMDWGGPASGSAVGAPAPSLRPAAEPATQPATTAATRPAIKTIHGTPGFWRLAEGQDGVWWFLSPQENLEFINSVTTVIPYQLARDPDGPGFVSSNYNGGNTPNGDLDAWAVATLERVRDTGFKALGAWCHPALHKLDVPMTRDLNVWTWMAAGSKRLFSPDWAATAERAIRVQVETLRDNRNLVGYFIDNELDCGDGAAGPGVYFDHLESRDPNRQEVIKILRQVWPAIDQFNADWSTGIRDWSELDGWTTLPHNQPAYGRLFTAWLSHLAENYFRTTTALIRKHDPNHLILGVRYKGYAPLEVCRASRGYTDAQSLNYYVSDGRLDLDLFRMIHEQSGQPLIISEYSFHALDGRSGNRNTFGFAAQVLDQQARADGYRLFTTRLARVPYVIGAEWFQWADEPPSGRSHDGEDVNFGIVDVDDRPYEKLVEAIRKTTPQLNALHRASATDEQKDVWRPSFAAKPVANVPFLGKPVVLNGELSDWPAQSRVQGIRHSETIGLDRSPLPLPNVYLGWTKDGLFVGLEVFDNDISGAPAKGWWWTRDNVEFWINTRPVPSDQDSFDTYSHQFFFVPQESIAAGVAGVVGQWHRPGDALKDHLIPHPQVKNAVRIHQDRYVVEMFIPRAALSGFDPVKQPALAFNVQVRNFQHAADYFWSAPKEILTQLRPNTWGPMYLEPALQAGKDGAQAAAVPSGSRR